MVQFLVKRFVGLIFVVLCVTFITFIFGYLAPGDPIQVMLGQHFNPPAYMQLRHAYGLDLSWYQQYFRFLGGLLHLDFGYSYYYPNKPVWDMLKVGIPTSLELGMWGLLVTLLIGIPLGVFSALKANTWIDTTNMTAALVIYSLPSFVLAVFAQVFILWFDKWTGLEWPVANWGTTWHYTWGDIQYKLVPVLVYAATGFAYYTRLTRTSVLEVLHQDYIRTAYAKGLRERIVVYRHAMRNALIPLVTVIGLTIGTLVTGVFFIELIYNIPGIGSITLNAIGYRDYPVIQATAVLGSGAVVVGNLISDILYTLVDPRIKAE
jgi:peptide/nickel transport system permease protein/oligopeptide transport system permease protein